MPHNMQGVYATFLPMRFRSSWRERRSATGCASGLMASDFCGDWQLSCRVRKSSRAEPDHRAGVEHELESGPCTCMTTAAGKHTMYLLSTQCKEAASREMEKRCSRGRRGPKVHAPPITPPGFPNITPNAKRNHYRLYHFQSHTILKGPSSQLPELPVFGPDNEEFDGGP